MMFYEAKFVDQKGDPAEPAAAAAGDGPVDRIRKLLERGLHPGTPPAEAAQAMRLANNLLVRHQLTQAAVMKEGCQAHARDGAMYTVRVKDKKNPSRSAATNLPRPNFVHLLGQALAEMFTVKMYYRCTKQYFDVNMYGVDMQAKLAAMEFETCFNACVHHTMRDVRTTQKRTDYADGFARGVHSKVRACKDDAAAATTAATTEPHGVTSRDLVIYNERSLAVADAFLASTSLNVRAGKKVYKKRPRDADAYSRGMERGKKHEFQAARLPTNKSDAR